MKKILLLTILAFITPFFAFAGTIDPENISPFTVTCDVGEDRLWVYDNVNGGYMSNTGTNLGELNNGNDEYPDGQFPCGQWLLPNGDYQAQFCYTTDTTCSSNSVNFLVTSQQQNTPYFSVGSTMTKDNTQNTILNSLIDWGLAVLAIIGAVLAVGVAYLIFRFGWRAIQNSLGGYGHGEKDGSWTYKPGKGTDKHRDTFNDPNFKY